MIILNTDGPPEGLSPRLTPYRHPSDPRLVVRLDGKGWDVTDIDDDTVFYSDVEGGGV